MRRSLAFLTHARPVRFWHTGIALGVSLVLTIIAAYYLHHNTVRNNDGLRFQSLSRRVQHDIESRIETYIALLRAGVGLFAAAESLDQKQFRAFVDRLELRQRYPGIQGIGFSRRIRPEDKATMVASRRREEHDTFRVWPEYERPEYHAILYLEPLDRRNQAAIGYDMSTEPARRTAMERARDTGLPAASGKVTLVQEIDDQKQAGFLIYIPVYQGGGTPATLAERRSLLLGFIYSPFRVNDFLHSILGTESPAEMSVRIFASPEPLPEHLLYASTPDGVDAFASPLLTAVTEIDVAGQPWSIAFATRPQFAVTAERQSTLLLLTAIGLLFSVIAFWVVRSQFLPDTTPHCAVLKGTAVARFRAMSATSGWLTLGVGIIVWLGWRYDMPPLKSVFPGFVTMKANAAVGFMLAGVALVRLQARSAPCRLGQVGAAVVALLGSLTLVQYALGWDLGIDQVFFTDAVDAVATSTPGRMSVFTALNFSLFGLALVLLDVQTRQGQRPAEYLVLTGLLVSLLTFMEYIYGAETFTKLAPDFTSMALHTAITFLVVGCGILLARPDRGMMVILSSDTDGGRMGRRLLPVAFIFLIIMGWIEHQGVRAGLYSAQFGLALLTVSEVFILAFLIMLNANHLYQSNIQRQQAEEELQESEARFRTIVEAMPIPVVINHLADGLILYANAHYGPLFGLPSDAVIGRKTTDFFYDPADRQQFLETLQKEGRIYNYEILRKKADGTPAWIIGSFQRFMFNDEPAVVGGFYDITERKQAEEALQRTAAELARSNTDLEQFAYAASHDLQEPLRAVSGCLQLLQQKYITQLDAPAVELINHAVDGAIRMQTLIHDLLTYSRLSTRGNPFTPVASATVLEQVLANLRLAIAESGAVVTHDPLPTVRADAIQLLQVFQNLLGNALKFRGEQPPAIHVGAQYQDDAWVFAVHDNGIGIAPRHAERIFTIFQRLHTRRRYPGTGIGLALCKKIVERHGGRIWVESAPGQGATFCFTIPSNVAWLPLPEGEGGG